MIGIARLAGLIQRFARSREGVAAVEFALILPIMLTLYLGSIEASRLISVDRRVTLVAGALGDLIARQQTSITAATVTSYMNLTKDMMAQAGTGIPKQTVSLVYLKDGVSSVVWSSAQGGATARAEDSAFPFATTDQIKTLVPDGYVVVSEVSYSYAPLLDLFFKSSFELYHRGVYLPRFGNIISCADC